MPDSYFGTFEDLSDPERGREDDWLDAWSALDEEQEPPEDPDSCPACGDREGGCLVCAARPEGGERDG